METAVAGRFQEVVEGGGEGAGGGRSEDHDGGCCN